MATRLTYERWVEDNQSILENLSGKDIILAYSGGKDSSVVLHFLHQASKTFGFEFQAHAAVFPHHVLTGVEREKLGDFWRRRGVQITWHTVSETDEELSEALSSGISPCLVCNKAKRKVIMNYFRRTRPDWEKLVLIVSYSLWDLVSATIEHILGAIYADADLSRAVRSKTAQERSMETSQRFYPMLRLTSGLTIYRPLIKYNDQDILKVVEENGLPLATPACNFKEYRPKRLLATYYHKMDLHFSLDKVLEFAQTALKVPDLKFFSEMPTEDYMKKLF